jgi:hypothetical protein
VLGKSNGLEDLAGFFRIESSSPNGLHSRVWIILLYLGFDFCVSKLESEAFRLYFGVGVGVCGDLYLYTRESQNNVYNCCYEIPANQFVTYSFKQLIFVLGTFAAQPLLKGVKLLHRPYCHSSWPSTILLFPE